MPSGQPPMEVGIMKRRIPKTPSDLAGLAGPITPGGPEPLEQQDQEDRTVGRRALLTRGGGVALGAVGAGVAAAALTGPPAPGDDQPRLDVTNNNDGGG